MCPSDLDQCKLQIGLRFVEVHLTVWQTQIIDMLFKRLRDCFHTGLSTSYCLNSFHALQKVQTNIPNSSLKHIFQTFEGTETMTRMH